jgi:hypothetical protein
MGVFQKYRRLSFFALVIALAFGILMLQFAAQSTTGSSQLVIAKNITIPQTIPGSNQAATSNIPYTVKLLTGSAGNTIISPVNWPQLSTDGFTLGLSAPYGTPNFDGTLTIQQVSSHEVPIGTYNIEFVGTGADPFPAMNITLNIVAAPPTTTAYTTTITSGAPTTTIVQAQNIIGNALVWVVVAIIAIILIAIVVAEYRRMRHKRGY